MRLDRKTASSSISRRRSIFPPAAFTWTPACSHSPFTTGSRLLVIVVTIWLCRTASSAELAGKSFALMRGVILSMNDWRRSGRLLTIHTRFNWRTASIAWSWVSACHPAPKRAESVAPGFERIRVARPVAAPVRFWPSVSASINASISAVSAE